MSRRWRGTALALVAAGLPGFAGCGRQSGAPVAEASTAVRAVPVTVAPLERRSVERTVEVVGTLKGWEEVTIGTKREGRVARLFHDIGDEVKPGELVVELESHDADLEVKQAERRLEAELSKIGLKELPRGDFDVRAVPAVAQAEAALEKARQVLARERSLVHRGAGTQESLQNAESDERGAEAALANAKLTARATLAGAWASRVALELMAAHRRDQEIHAPVPSSAPGDETGPVTYAVARRRVSEGQMLKAGDPVADLVIRNPLRLWANVPERSSADVSIGQPVRIRVPAHPGSEFSGKVSRINPSVDPDSRTFQVEVSVPNRGGLLRPGGFAKASILTDRQARASVVPIESVVHFAGVTKLFVIDGDKARSVNVETGVEGKGWIEVLGELPKSAQVVTTGQSQLADGTPVVVRGPEKTAAGPGRAQAPTPGGAR